MNRKGFSSTITVILVLLTITVLGVLIVMWLNNNKPDDQTVNETQDTAKQVENDVDNDLLSRIVDNPSQYYGQKLTVEGEIQDLQSKRVFKISDQTAGDELLVITKNPLSQSQTKEAEELFEDNADVSATGTLRQLVIAEIEKDFNIDLTEELEVEFKDRPILVADSFSFSDNKAVLDFNQGP